MIFEETLVFYDRSDAENFTKQLLTEGYRTKTKTVNTLVNEAHCKGKICELKGYFEDELKSVSEDGEIAEEITETYTSIIADIDTVIADLEGFLNKCDDGAVISDDPEVKRFLDILKKESDGDTAGDVTDGSDDFFSRMLRIMLVLNDNDMIEDVPGAGGGEPKKILRKNNTPVKDLLMSMPSDLFMGGDSQNNRRAHGIKTVINVVSGAEYHVTTPPDFSLAVNFDKLDRMVADYDIDPASYTKMKENIIAKNMVAKNILACIKNEGKTSLDEIYETVRSSSVEVSSGSDEFVFDLGREFIAEVLSEMKIMGIIKGKGNRFRA